MADRLYPEGKANFKLAQTAIRALAEQCKLLGLHAPQRIELQAEPEPSPEPDLSLLSDDRVLVLRDLLAKARGAGVEDVTPVNGAPPTVRRYITTEVQ